jgi:vancomycin resistance protein YoaR
MSSRPKKSGPPTRPSINRRFVRPNYRPARPNAPTRRIFPRRLDRPAFKDRRARARDIYLRLGIGAGIVVVLSIAFVLFEGFYATRVNPHVSVDGIPLGGVSLSDVPTYLQQKLDQRNNEPIILHVDDRVYQVTSSQFRAHYDIARAIAQAQNDGHAGDFITRVWNQFNTVFSGHDYPLTGTHDAKSVQSFLARVASDIADDPQPAQVGVQDNEVTIIHESVLGRKLDLPAATRLLNTELDRHSVFNINIPVLFPSSPISHDVAQQTVNRAQDLLSQNVFFSSLQKVRAWYLKPSQLLHLLTFTPGYDPKRGWVITMGLDTARLAVTMAPIAAAVNHEAVPAYYKFVDAANGQPDTAVPYPDSPGLAIDIDKAAQAILASPSTGHTATIPFTHPRAAFTLADARAMAFDTLQGKGISGVLGSTEERLINAHNAAGKLNNIRLDPGQQLSVTTVITPVVQANGFIPEEGGFGLKYDIAGTNGGPSQAASALFQAAYRAGLTIVQRQSYPNVTVLNGPPGTDAIVQARPHGADLQLVNNTKHVILIGVRVTHDDSIAYVFNNSSVHRTVTVFGPVVTLNLDGSIDAQIGRVTSGDRVLQDQFRTHYNAVDRYP